MSTEPIVITTMTPDVERLCEIADRLRFEFSKQKDATAADTAAASRT